MFLIRNARPGDLRQLLKLAHELDSINLPAESTELRALLERSERSFAGRIRQRSRAVYLFCAEAVRTGTLAGASMIIGKHGTPRAPHYYLQIDSDERYSHALRKMFRHTYLRLRYSMDGPSELGGLIVKRAMRRNPERVGRQLSWVRFLYIAKHRARFERELIAEMLPPMTPGYRNAFWDHWGGLVTGLTFREADRLSSRDKQFIRELFPESPLYTFLLPEDVRNSLGAAGDQTRGAVRLLEQAGMRFLDQNRSIRRRSLLRRRGWPPGTGQELPQLSDRERRQIARRRGELPGGARRSPGLSRGEGRGARRTRALGRRA